MFGNWRAGKIRIICITFMVVTVKLKYLRISPRKIRLVTDLIKGKTIQDAENVLEFARKKAVRSVKKLLKSAVAAAEHDFQKVKSNLYISKIAVGEGPTLKRFRFRGGGRIFPVAKRTSHVTLTLDEIKPAPKVRRAKRGKKEIRKEVGPQKGKAKALKEGRLKTRPRISITKPRFKVAAKKMFRRKAF